MEVEIIISQLNSTKREQEPVAIGVPLTQGWIQENETLQLQDDANNNIPIQVTPLSLWGDGSFKWVLIDFFISIPGNSEKIITLCKGNKDLLQKHIKVEEKSEIISIDTGSTQFSLSKNCFDPFCMVVFEGENVLKNAFGRCVLVGEKGEEYLPVISDSSIELIGEIRVVVKVNGSFVKDGKEKCGFEARIHFYGEKSYVKIDFTLINSKPSRHAGGLWDLGDPGSVFFKDLSLHLTLAEESTNKIAFSLESKGKMQDRTGDNLSIYQDSSGGENWKSQVHINKFGKVPILFKGYQVILDGDKIEKGSRANPIVFLGNEDIGISVAVSRFWQNFPKAIEVDMNQIVVRLFPQQFGDLYELQGGERKTHTVFLDFSGKTDTLNWIHSPLRPIISRQYYADSKAIPYLSAGVFEVDGLYEKLVKESLAGESSFFSKREVVDEYGWRNFGEVYADHEAIGCLNDTLIVSHYNNQYDQVYGFFREFVASEKPGWFELMDDLAAHVYDIDIYYTTGDRPEYNLALHWHTNHYLDAGSCTHRSFSKTHLDKYDPQFYGGGPSMEHCYASGLMYHHFLTGDARSRESVLCLAKWICNAMSKQNTVLGLIFDTKKKIPEWKRVFSGEQIRADEFPFTRGSGNAISALLDAFTLTHEKMYLLKAEEIIRGCVHPHDNIESRDLLNAELCWSYNVLLQAFGKYLDVKKEVEQIDEMYAYTQQSLLHYAKWMLENEYPYLEKDGELEFPNETWPAQDLRKSCVFYFAAKHCTGDLRNEFLTKALFFHKYAIEKISEFKTKSLARPIALLMQNRWMYSYFSENPESSCEIAGKIYDFSSHSDFWTKTMIAKELSAGVLRSIKGFSIKAEKHWLDCRRCKHI